MTRYMGHFSRNGITGRSRLRRGAVLIILLTAIFILTGLFVFVLNLGDQENVRLMMQDAADSAAISGSGWMARSMNVIAVNNVTIARLISLVSVMDALPLAAEMTIAEQTAMRRIPDALDPYDPALPQFTPYEKENFFNIGLSYIYTEMYKQMGDEDGTQMKRLQEIDKCLRPEGRAAA